jgi:hypothetical protein
MTDRSIAPLSEPALDQLFRTARTRNAWVSRPASEPIFRPQVPETSWHARFDLRNR